MSYLSLLLLRLLSHCFYSSLHLCYILSQLIIQYLFLDQIFLQFNKLFVEYRTSTTFLFSLLVQKILELFDLVVLNWELVVFKVDLLLETLNGGGDWCRVGRTEMISVSDTLVGELDLAGVDAVCLVLLDNDIFDLEIVGL